MTHSRYGSPELQAMVLARAIEKQKVQQPLTSNQIDAIENKVYMSTTNKGKSKYDYVTSLVRAVEASHGIKGASL
jgi:hypothetical protein